MLKALQQCPGKNSPLQCWETRAKIRTDSRDCEKHNTAPSKIISN